LWGTGRIKALAEPIFVRGVSPFYDRRTLRPPELEGLRNLPQKFHFPYWGRKGKENKSRPSKTRRSAAQTSICAAARAGFLREVRPHLGLGKKQKHPPSAKPKRARVPLRRAFAPPRGRAFLREVRPHLGLGKNKNTPKRKAKTRRSAAQTSICAAARAGIIQRRICPVARRRKAEYQRRYGAFWRRVRILR